MTAVRAFLLLRACSAGLVTVQLLALCADKKKKALIYTVCRFRSCKYSHHRRSRATCVMSLMAGTGRDADDWLS